MNETLSWRTLRLIAGGPRRMGLLALLALVLAALFALWTSRSMLRALSAPAGAPAVIASADSHALADDLQARSKMINGRSMFFIPDRPRPPSSPERPLASNPPPSRYAGPQLVAMVNDTAWFLDGTRIKLGEEPKAGAPVKLVSLSPPWSARVEWKGVEFTVSLFERSTALSPPKAPPAGEPGATPDDASKPAPESASTAAEDPPTPEAAPAQAVEPAPPPAPAPPASPAFTTESR